MRALLDRQLGRITMYRLVTVLLLLLAVVMMGFTAAGTFDDPFSVDAQLMTLAVLVAASYLSSWLFGRLVGVRAHAESSVITGLLLFFLFWPSTDIVDLSWLALAAALAGASKYLLAWHGRHIFNPAAAGAFAVMALQEAFGRDSATNGTWWIAAERMLPFVAVAALLVLWRTRRLGLGLVFVVLAATGCIVALHQAFGTAWDEAARTTFYSFPVIFLAGFMLSEPLTLPPRRLQQIAVAVTVAAVFVYPTAVLAFTDTPPDLGVLRPTPEIALLVGNLLAFALARRRGVELKLTGTKRLTPHLYELEFESRRRVPFQPGQYMELTLPHARTDLRGSRRTFTISSPPSPAASTSFVVRIPPQASSFKRALVDLEPGHIVRSTGVAGDFLWPRDPAVPLLLVAGGIGVTPFLSQVRHHRGRDVVLVLGLSGADELAFTDEFAEIPVVLVCPERPERLPENWRWVAGNRLSAALIESEVPDVSRRRAYISGPPMMVNAVRAGLMRRCRGVRTDYFSGY